jgi:Protein NO VEIN, C-terminal
LRQNKQKHPYNLAAVSDMGGIRVSPYPKRNRGPSWSRDEVILALSHYRRIGKVPEEYEPAVVDIADLIGRTADSVVYKIANLRSLETRGRRGLSHSGAIDRRVWNEFRGRDSTLFEEEEKIRRTLRMTPEDEMVLEKDFARNQGFMASPEDRKKIEEIAMRRAKHHFETEGYVVADVHATRPYDLKCTRNGEEYFVEVKGTTGEGKKILLTAGEVEYAKRHASKMIFFLTYSIRPDDDDSENGTVVIRSPWTLDARRLAPVSYFYEL